MMPRVFAVNHHPEIVDRSRQMLILRQKLERGEVDQAWFEDRARVLTETYSDDARDQRLHLTSDYTLMGPVRYPPLPAGAAAGGGAGPSRRRCTRTWCRAVPARPSRALAYTDARRALRAALHP